MDDLAALVAAARAKGISKAAAKPRARATGRALRGVGFIVAVVMGVATAGGILYAWPATHWLQARLTFAAGLPSGSPDSLRRVRRELAAKLIEADLLGASGLAETGAIDVDAQRGWVTVRLLTDQPAEASRILNRILAQCRDRLQAEADGTFQAHRKASEEVAELRNRLQELQSRRAAIEQALKRDETTGQAYTEALAEIQQSRDRLAALQKRVTAANARLRLLRRTPPPARVEVTADRLDAAVAADVQLVETGRELSRRAEDLRSMLVEQLRACAKRCSQLAAKTEQFMQFLAVQRDHLAETPLAKEVAQILQQAQQLRAVALRLETRIGAVSKTAGKPVSPEQAGSLVSAHMQTMPQLESLAREASDAMKRIDRLLEKIPAGGTDVTRRTVLQERLRARFAPMQEAHDQLATALNGLKPAVNFRLDAALTAVAGLSRRWHSRRDALLERLQQAEAEARRRRHQQRLQEVRDQLEQLAAERDRLVDRILAAMERMQAAEPARKKCLDLQGKRDELAGQIAAVRERLAAAEARVESLAVAASQPVGIGLQPARTLWPPANRAARLATAATSGVVAFLLVLSGVVLLGPYWAGKPRR